MTMGSAGGEPSGGRGTSSSWSIHIRPSPPEPAVTANSNAAAWSRSPPLRGPQAKLICRFLILTCFHSPENTTFRRHVPPYILITRIDQFELDAVARSLPFHPEAEFVVALQGEVELAPGDCIPPTGEMKIQTDRPADFSLVRDELELNAVRWMRAPGIYGFEIIHEHAMSRTRAQHEGEAHQESDDQMSQFLTLSDCPRECSAHRFAEREGRR